VRLPDGGSASREYVLHPGAVAVVPLLDDGRIVLERQYRHPMRQVMIELPAGKMDEGEGALVCGRRELLEETGYVAREWAYAFTLYPTVAYSDEAIEVWFARGLEHRGAQLDHGEFLDVFTATPAEFLEWCRDGRITDSKTLAAALWIQNVLAGAWKLDWQTPSEAA
jgi:ADP-ribose pyrophosphatase